MKSIRRALTAALLFTLLLGLAFLGYALLRNRPQDLPWTRLDLTQPIGAFTGRKLVALTGEFAHCRALLKAAGVRYEMLSPVKPRPDGKCGYADVIRFETGGAQQIEYSPDKLGVSCPVAAGLALWEWNVLQPAARTHLKARVVEIEHLGSYSCRRIYGRSSGDWSEHATADAVDIAAFVLSDGTRVSVLKDWKGSGPKARFLHAVRTGGCRLFSTVLSPDYNEAHRDHLHLDQAERGEMGWRTCR